MCPAINEIDISALEILESINQYLRELDIGFHFSEVKGPVMDHLKKSDFLEQLNGQVFLSQHQAIEAILHNNYLKAREKPEFTDFQI